MSESNETAGGYEPETRLPAESAREPFFNLPWIVVALIVACTSIHLIRLYLLTPEQDFDLIIHGAFIPVRYSGQYTLDIFAFTSPLTSSLLHGGWGHLGLNMIWLAAFGSPLANRIGWQRFALFWIFCTLAACLAHYLNHAGDATPVIGASGAISGMMGAAARFGFQIDRRHRTPVFSGRLLTLRETLMSRTAVVFLGITLLLNLAAGAGLDLSGSQGSIAWEAHIGGVLAGLLCIGLFDRRPRRDLDDVLPTA